MYKLIYGLEGKTLRAFTGSFQDTDKKADDVLLDAVREHASGGEFAGKTFVVILTNERGGLCYARHYTVSH